jgi:hypothetical protein
MGRRLLEELPVKHNWQRIGSKIIGFLIGCLALGILIAWLIFVLWAGRWLFHLF